MAKQAEAIDDVTDNEGAKNPTQPEGWHPERLRARDGVKTSDLKGEQPDYESRHSSDAYLDMNFGRPPEELSNHIGQAIDSALSTVKQSWREVDEAKGPILRNEMEAQAKRLDQLDQYAATRRKAAETALSETLERIDREIEASHEVTASQLKPEGDETALIATWQATLANKSSDELADIVSGALEDGDMLVLKAALGGREWMVPLGAHRERMVRRFEEEVLPGVGPYGVASYRDRLHKLRNQITQTQQTVARHFDGVLTPRQKTDLERARERAAEASKV